MRLGRRLLFIGIILLVVAGLAEFMAYLKARQLVGHGIAFNPLVTNESHRVYLGRSHPRLGWTPAPEKVDALGSRPIPAFHDPLTTRACVSLYGDSFTEGAGVDNEHAWSNVLSVLLDCRVANFGVSGYGTDQAYLSFAGNRTDAAKVVILGFLSENVMRNVNQLRNLISQS
ncbi:MAG: SGNH/GDSL hydrolase family protein, partial [Desulfobaccales bacterium]